MNDLEKEKLLIIAIDYQTVDVMIKMAELNAERARKA